MIERRLELESVLAAQDIIEKFKDDLFSEKNPPNQQLYRFLWRSEDEYKNMAPTSIIGDEDSILNLIADVATFYPDYSPISSYFHLFEESLGDPNEIQILKRENQRNKICFPSGNINNIWIALALSESITSLHLNSEHLQSVSFSLCRRSLSFTLARSLYLYPHYSLSNIIDRWKRLREISNLPVSSDSVDALSIISRFLSKSDLDVKAIYYEHIDLLSAIQNFADTVGSLDEISNIFSSQHPEINNFISFFEKSFDDRIGAFNNIIQQIVLNSQDKVLCSIAIGHFANLLLPGSLSHVKLVAKHENNYPGSLLWYGFFSGATPGFSAERAFGGLGRKLLRDLFCKFDPFLPPTADISLTELESLSRLRAKGDVIKPVHQKAVFVSLLPGVDVMSRFSDDEIDEQQKKIARTSSKNETNSRDSDVRKLIKAALVLLEGEAAMNSVDDARSSKKSETAVRRKKKTTLG